MTTAVRTGGAGAAGVSVLVIPTNAEGFSARKIENSGVNAGGKSPDKNAMEALRDLSERMGGP